MKKSTMFLASAVAALALFISTNVNAQSSPKFGMELILVHLRAMHTVLQLVQIYAIMFDIDKQLSIPITAGYTRFLGKDNFPDFGYIPAKAGLKYFFNDTGAGVYGLAEAGAGFSTNSGGGTSFVYSPAVGYSWSNGLDLAAKYEGLSKNSVNTGYVGLRLAYGFKL